MKKYFIIALSLCAIMSCSKENTITNNTPLSFTAGFDESTKSMLNDNRSQSWLGGDKVTVYDITDGSTTASARFTNISATPSSSAIFTLDDEFSSFSFEEDHKYLALHNATIIKSTSSYRTISFAKTISFDSSKKYGMPDNTIPVASFFTYSGKPSLQNISFHNITALCVVRVKNNTASAIHISEIKIKESYTGVAWAGMIFGACIYYYTGFGNYDLKGTSASTNSFTISCDTNIDAGATCDFSSIMVRPNNLSQAGTITLTVDVMDSSDCLAEDGKVVIQGTYNWKAGDTKVFNIDVNPS